MSQIACTATNLAAIFLFILPLNFFERVSKWTNKYAYKDWKIEKIGNDRDMNKKKVRHFDVPDRQRRHKKHQHRADKEQEQFTITPGFVLCWFAALILQGALFGEHKPRANDLYATEGANGVNVPIYNA